MVSVGTLTAQRAEVANVATKLFGKPFAPEQVIPEYLDRSLSFNDTLPTGAELAAAIAAGVNSEDDVAMLKAHPVAVWLENTSRS